MLSATGPRTWKSGDHEPAQFIKLVKEQIEMQGPVVANMDVYADFIFYKSGVYTVSLYMLQPI
jgi:hypothetical protein